MRRRVRLARSKAKYTDAACCLHLCPRQSRPMALCMNQSSTTADLPLPGGPIQPAVSPLAATSLISQPLGAGASSGSKLQNGSALLLPDVSCRCPYSYGLPLVLHDRTAYPGDCSLSAETETVPGSLPAPAVQSSHGGWALVSFHPPGSHIVSTAVAAISPQSPAQRSSAMVLLRPPAPETASAASLTANCRNRSTA